MPQAARYQNPLEAKLGRKFFATLPREPGIYLMRDVSGELLYIGKAKDLRARLQSYRRLNPDNAPEHSIELVENIARIELQLCASETEALARESDLLHALRPPFNIAQTDAESYLFVGFKRQGERAHFLLTSRERGPERPSEPPAHPEDTRVRVFGCYRHRRAVKSGYTALLRLLHAAQAREPRFHFPARITRGSPPYVYESRFKMEWEEPLTAFLEGRSPRLLGFLLEAMLASENIPRFMHPALQDDFGIAKAFYRLGPRTTRKLLLRSGTPDATLSHAAMDRLVAEEWLGGPLQNTKLRTESSADNWDADAAPASAAPGPCPPIGVTT